MKYNNNFNVRDAYKELEVSDIISHRIHKDFAVATFNLKGDLNLGSIMRTAEITGAKDFFILGHRKWDRRSAVGVQNYLNVEKHDECVDWKSTESLLIDKRYSPIVVEHGGLVLSEWISFVTQNHYIEGLPPCFIFGPEDTGFEPEWPAHITLEQTGVSRSYNVSAAAAIVLYNWSFNK
jgi:tRNA G18 (ribose-2'-O)-methylase SpoU